LFADVRLAASSRQIRPLPTFSDLLLEAQKRRLLKLESDKNAGDYFLLPED